MTYGEAARSAYTAASFFSDALQTSARGAVHAGTVAGECAIPALTEADRAQIADMAQAADPKDDIHPILDRSILLAQCGSMGDFGIVFWGHDRNGDDKISGTEIVRRQGRWVENKGQVLPGCTIPLDAAAAWQIDVSHCPAKAPRPHPRGQLD